MSLRSYVTIASLIVAVGAISLGLQALARAYVIRGAQQDLEALLVYTQALHMYIQQDIRAETTRLKEQGQVAPDFFSPVLHSSSYISRHTHAYARSLWQAGGHKEFSYRMAAINPRNEINRADARERRLIEMFNRDRSLRDYTEVISRDGSKSLYYARPFLVIEESCLHCHGDPEDAPRELRERYGDQNGFHRRLGSIAAIEAITIPVATEFKTANLVFLASLITLTAAGVLVLINRRLNTLVRRRTEILHQEVDERRRIERRLRGSEERYRRLSEDLERRVVQRTEELAGANRELEAFAYSVSHDLQAPLRGIQGYSGFLLEDYAGSMDADGRRYLDRIRAASLRMGKTIDGLLRLSRLSRGNLQLERVDLTALAREITAELREQHPDRAVAFTCEEGLLTEGDASLLRVVLDNLLGNAWKFTAARDAAQVAFGSTITEDGSAFFVRDNGTGFDMREETRLFRPFQRLHRSDRYPGTGIGLATVRRIVARHRGRVWAEGVPGQGATFYFTIPNASVSAA